MIAPGRRARTTSRRRRCRRRGRSARWSPRRQKTRPPTSRKSVERRAGVAPAARRPSLGARRTGRAAARSLPARPRSIPPLHGPLVEVEGDDLARRRRDQLVGEVADPDRRARPARPTSAASRRPGRASRSVVALDQEDPARPRATGRRPRRRAAGPPGPAGACQCQRRTSGSGTGGWRPVGDQPGERGRAQLGRDQLARRSSPVPVSSRDLGKPRQQLEVGVAGRDAELLRLVGAGQPPERPGAERVVGGRRRAAACRRGRPRPAAATTRAARPARAGRRARPGRPG